MPTIKDIAAKANVSVTTASLVLNNKDGALRISEKTKQHVLGVAAELGYVPNMSARHLRMEGDRTLVVALLIPFDVRISLAWEILSGIQQYLTSDDVPYACTLMVETHRKGEIGAVRGLQSPIRFNGAIIANLSPEDQQHLHENPSRVPCVLFQRSSDFYPYVDADNEAAGREVARHFVSGGHREIVVIAPDITSDAIQRRVRGIMAEPELSRGSIKADILTGEFSEAGGYQTMKAYLREGKSPTAVVCLSDQMAIGALSALHEHGVAVPGECEVAGFDNLPVSSYTIPKLSTVHIPVRSMAYRAAQLLVQGLLDGSAYYRSSGQSQTFELPFVHRETTLPRVTR